LFINFLLTREIEIKREIKRNVRDVDESEGDDPNHPMRE
jgi:hypothetical protein